MVQVKPTIWELNWGKPKGPEGSKEKFIKILAREKRKKTKISEEWKKSLPVEIGLVCS